MNRTLLVAGATMALASGFACAASDSDDARDPETPPPPVFPDAAAVDASKEETGTKSPVRCSDAGWCVTPLPDTDLTVVDIWPFQTRAFAVVESITLGIKVMEWTDAEQRWSYIDDNTQNDDGFGKFVGRVWAPGEDEVYYAVDPGYIYHGKRGATAWTWERTPLPGTTPPAFERPTLGVWGTSADDLYAWYANTIFHRTSVDGGAPQWVAEYVGSTKPGQSVTIHGGGGSGKDDVWFGGGRGFGMNRCPVLLRKMPDGYRIVVDGTFADTGEFFGRCDARDGAVLLDAVTGWLTDIQPTSAGGIVALRAPDTVARIAPAGAGYTTAVTRFPQPTSYQRTTFFSMWLSGDDAWLSSSGLVLRGPKDGDTAAYAISSVAVTGAPLDRDLYRVRGTNNNNLWAVGPRYALHKTTP